MQQEKDGKTVDTHTLKGVSGTVRIVTDEWGVPHIYGDSLLDVLYGQGFNVARERLWQLDYWRRCGLGLLSEAFGEKYVERDRAARLFLYRGDMEAEWVSYSPDAKECLEAFVGGINAFITMTQQDASLLPMEFQALDYVPGVWEARDIPRMRSHGLYYNLRDEVSRARTIRDYGNDVEELRRSREPARALNVPDGLDLTAIADDVLRVYELAVSPPVFSTGDQVVQSKASYPEGSNNWTISGSRTQSGRPILANDPHRVMTSFPSMRYLVHLSAPGFDAIGGSEIGLPGLFTGHNERVAFGITYHASDQEDLYVYDLNPDNSEQYRYDDAWENVRTVTDTIPVRDQDPVDVELSFTRHGPLIYQDTSQHKAFAVRAAWLETGMAPYLGGLATMRSQCWDSFVKATRHWKAPCANVIFADVQGNIGWKVSGLIPVRKNWDGTMPVPGDGRYEWNGFFPSDELPMEYNPERGWVATANEMNTPSTYPSDRHLGYEWFSRLRKDRIDEVLGGSRSHTIESSNALQNDYCSLLARRIIARIAELPIQDPESHPGLSMLRGWDAVMTTDSSPAALFEVWYRNHLRPRLFERAMAQHMGADKVDAALKSMALAELVPDARVDLMLFETPQERLGADAEQWLADTVLDTLAQAESQLRKTQGEDMSAWRWGAVHTAQMAHPLRNILQGKLDADLLTTQQVARGGSGDTVCLTAYAPDFTQLVGSTLRIVNDVGEWDNSVAMNAPGQSGRLDSPFVANLLNMWAEGKTIPLLYSPEKVAAHAVLETVIEPKA